MRQRPRREYVPPYPNYFGITPKGQQALDRLRSPFLMSGGWTFITIHLALIVTALAVHGYGGPWVGIWPTIFGSAFLTAILTILTTTLLGTFISNLLERRALRRSASGEIVGWSQEAVNAWENKAHRAGFDTLHDPRVQLPAQIDILGVIAQLDGLRLNELTPKQEQRGLWREMGAIMDGRVAELVIAHNEAVAAQQAANAFMIEHRREK